jgi:DNA-binding IclR family transcriptional regulator
MSDEMEAEGGGPRRVGSVRHAAAILRHLEAIGIGAGVNPIARALDISPSSCFNLLKTLADERLVDFDGVTKQYSLGPGAIALGRRALDPRGSFELVRQRLEILADKHQVTACLWRTRRGDQFTIIGYAESAAAIRIHLTVGQRLPDAAGAGGRCIMAFSGFDDAAIRRRFDAVQWGYTPDPDAYLVEVKLARERGWAIDEGQFIKGMTTVAAPSLGQTGKVDFILTATMFTGQHPYERLQAIARDLGGAGAWLASRLSGGV